jgi:hypothetical protein
MIARSEGAVWNEESGNFFAVDEVQHEEEEADESFLEMEQLFHLKFGKKSKKNLKKSAGGQNDDIPDRPKSMAKQNFNPDEEDSVGTLDKARRKEHLKAHLAQRPADTYNPATRKSTVEGDDSQSGASDHTPAAKGKNTSSQSSSSSSTSSSESQSKGDSRSRAAEESQPDTSTKPSDKEGGDPPSQSSADSSEPSDGDGDD